MYATEIQVPFDLGDMIQSPNDVREISHKEEVYLLDNAKKLSAQAFNARLPKDSQVKLVEENDSDPRKNKPERSFEWEEEAAPGKKRKKRK